MGTLQRKLAIVTTLVVTLFVSQVAVISTASAAPGDPTDLNMFVGNNSTSYYEGGGATETWGHICSSGPGTVTSITFQSTTANWTLEQLVVADPSVNNNATDIGSIDENVWTGVLEEEQCLVINPSGTITGETGTNAEWTFTITSSNLVGDVENVDPNQTNQSDGFSVPIEAAADLAVESRLLTSDEISAGSTVSYEVYVKNIADVVLNENTIGVFFNLPQGASFTAVEDLNGDDALDLVGCQSMGLIEDMGPAFSAYSGEVIQCEFNSNTGNLAANSSYPIQFDMQASSAFASGATQVMAVALTMNMVEPESVDFMMTFGAGQDGFALDINNIFRLTYDADELQVTINRCEGIGDVVLVDDACFTVTFNKLIWGPSFAVEDLVLQGGGSVYSFVQDDDFTWTVRINGMTPGGTLRLLLGPDSVQDYSAVMNSTEVLGINEVQYGEISSEDGEETDSGSIAGSEDSNTDGTLSASATLPATGSTTTNLAIFSAMLMIFGAGLVRATKKTFIS